jgi:diacylglycerol kinase family enzyme
VTDASIVDVIVNRNAGDLRQDGAVRRALLREAAARGARVHETRTIEELEGGARALSERGAGCVVLAGGDGSHMAGLSALSRAFGGAMPRVALAPGGTVGIVASQVGGGGRGSAGARATRLLRAVCEGTAVERTTPTLRVRDDAGGDRVAFIFGAGLVARFFDVYDGQPRAPRAWSLVLASVVKDVGLGIRATYRAGERSDRFHAVASTRTPRGLAMQVPKVLTGRAMGRQDGGTDQVDALVKVMRVRFEASGTYVVDGDVVRAREVTVEAGPVVRVMVG